MNAQLINYCTCIIYNHKLYTTYFQYCKVIDTTDMSLFIKHLLISYSKVIGSNAVNEVVSTSTLEDL